jgi:hypothetical protein
MVGFAATGPAPKRFINGSAFSERFPIQTIGTQKARKRSFPHMNVGAPSEVPEIPRIS